MTFPETVITKITVIPVLDSQQPNGVRKDVKLTVLLHDVPPVILDKLLLHSLESLPVYVTLLLRRRSPETARFDAILQQPVDPSTGEILADDTNG